MGETTKESLLSMTGCDCSGVKAWAGAIAVEASAKGWTDQETEERFREPLDPNCKGQTQNPAYSPGFCGIPETICGDSRGVDYLLYQPPNLSGQEIHEQ